MEEDGAAGVKVAGYVKVEFASSQDHIKIITKL